MNKRNYYSDKLEKIDNLRIAFESGINDEEIPNYCEYRFIKFDDKYYENSFGIRKSEYTVVFKMCIVLLDELKAVMLNEELYDILVYSLLEDRNNEVIEFTDKIIRNDLSNISDYIHNAMIAQIGDLESILYKYGKRKKARILEEGRKKFLAKIKKEYGKGCYLATYVYNDYNSSELETLRKFRDEFLDNYFIGRIFIRVYYFLSIKLLTVLGEYNLFNILIKKLIESLLKKITIDEKNKKEEIY